MRKFGLIGFPLGHSFSKQYFADKFSRESISDCSYENYELADISLLKEVILSDDEICGLNVTIPYKTSVIKYIDNLDHEASLIGAVNVIRISSPDGKKMLNGFNTDIYGFRESILPYLRNDIRAALVLGTGGSSKAIDYVLASMGIKVTNVSRHPNQGCIAYGQVNEKVLSENQLIVNTTPLGMYPETGTLPDIKYQFLNSNHILYDLVYNPEDTLFLQAGKERGCTVIGGKMMLNLQAEKSWSIWNNNDL